MTRVTRRVLSTLTALVMVGTLFIGAPGPVRATADHIYIGFNTHMGGGSCTDPDFTADGIDDSAQIALAVADTNVNGTLHFCPGTYDIDATIDLSGTDITLQGAAAATTILDGGGAVRILYSSGAITVSDLTFDDGYTAGDDGGAIRATTATVTDSSFTNNTADDGGAINASTATVTDSTFTANTATQGGAIYTATTAVTRSTFTNNTANYGGAIYAGGTATVTDSTFTRNSATTDGGAIAATNGTIARSRFTRNTAGEHGGAVTLSSPNSDNLQQLRGNTFTRNQAGAGGAITLGSCGPAVSRSQVRSVERANRFSANRATEQRRTNNIESETGYCPA